MLMYSKLLTKLNSTAQDAGLTWEERGQIGEKNLELERKDSLQLEKKLGTFG